MIFYCSNNEPFQNCASQQNALKTICSNCTITSPWPSFAGSETTLKHDPGNSNTSSSEECIEYHFMFSLINFWSLIHSGIFKCIGWKLWLKGLVSWGNRIPNNDLQCRKNKTLSIRSFEPWCWNTFLYFPIIWTYSDLSKSGRNKRRNIGPVCTKEHRIFENFRLTLQTWFQNWICWRIRKYKRKYR